MSPLSFEGALDEPSLPERLSEIREAAAAQFRELELPDPSSEEWRYTDISRVDLDALEVGDSSLAITSTGSGRAVAGQLADHLDELGESAWSVVDPMADKFVSTAAALPSEGIYIRVPAGVDAGRVEIEVRADEAGRVSAPFFHIVAEEGSSLSAVILKTGKAEEQRLQLPVVEVLAGPNSSVEIATVQLYGSNVDEIETVGVEIGRDARVRVAAAALGGRIARTATRSVLAGEGGESELSGFYFGTGGEHFDFRVFQDHRAPRTRSNILYKGAVDESSAVFAGLIRVEKDAQKITGTQTNRNLVLSEGAWAESIPNLEILANDVSCSHASATGPVDEEEMFYLATRAIPPDVARRLIILGFFEEAIARFPEFLRERLRSEIEEKFDA